MPVSLRIEAVNAGLLENAALNESQFSLLYSQFTETSSTIVARQAATTLSSSKLTESQLEHLSKEVLPVIDPFVLPTLLPVFEQSKNTTVGLDLIDHLSRLPSLDNFTEDYITALFDQYPEQLNDPLDDLLAKIKIARDHRIKRIALLENVISEGSEEKGRALYFGKAICSTCHTMREVGGTLGPDLTAIQKDRSVHDIIEAIVYPSVSFVREFETYQIITTSNEYTGIIKEQTPDMIMLETAPGSLVRISVNDVKKIEQLDVSMMPQGLDQLLTEEEFGHLMAYLIGKDLEY